MGRRLEQGVNDLATVYPDLVLEWDYEGNKGLVDGNGKDISTPDKVIVGSHHKVSWRCKDCGYIWKERIHDRLRGSGKCPSCAEHLPVFNKKSLFDTHPHIATLWHPTKNTNLKPTSVSAGSHKKAWWQCEKGHSWFDFVYSVVRAKEPCPYCGKRLPILNETDLITTHPDIAKEWDYESNKNLKDGHGKDVSIPDKVCANSTMKVFWKCNICGQSWNEAIVERTRNNYSCPYCSGHLPIPNKTDLATTHPKIAAEWHPTKNIGLVNGFGRDISTPDKVTSHSSQVVWWKCPVCKQEWESTVRNRTIGSGCPICSGHKIVSGINDLATVCPKIAKEWHPTKNIGLKDGNGKDISSPDMIFWGSSQNIWWSLPYDVPMDYPVEHLRGKHFDFEWPAVVYSRTKRDSQCPFLCGKAVWKEFNDLATVNPELAAQWHPVQNKRLKDKNGNDISTPDKVTASSGQKVWWLLPYDVPMDYPVEHLRGKHFDFEWEATVANRVQGRGCPYLSNPAQAVWKGFNDLETTHPDLAKLWHPILNGTLKPTDVSAGSNRKVWWRCKYGHKWKSAVSHITSGQGCPHCKESRGEKAIRKVLEANNILFTTQYKFKNRFGPSGKQLLKDDFAIFDINDNVVGTVEYHGEQHYFPVDFVGKGQKAAIKKFELAKECDKIKTTYLQAHNIPQLIIPYWDFDNIETIVKGYISKLPLGYPPSITV